MSQISADSLASLGRSRDASQTRTKRDELGQTEFLKLMTAQLASQDPFEPMENGEFLGQMAQFSTVSGIEELNQSLSTMVSTMAQSFSQGQTLQAASLVGRQVLIPASSSSLSEGQGIEGAVEVPATSDVSIEVYDAIGQCVWSKRLGPLGAGMHEFEWDGKLANDSNAPAGTYQVRAFATGTEGSTALSTLLDARVDSVSVDQAGDLMLSVQGLGSVSLSDVRRIG